jgi:hypothetical protein
LSQADNCYRVALSAYVSRAPPVGAKDRYAFGVSEVQRRSWISQLVKQMVKVPKLLPAGTLESLAAPKSTPDP